MIFQLSVSKIAIASSLYVFAESGHAIKLNVSFAAQQFVRLLLNVLMVTMFAQSVIHAHAL